MYVTHSWVLLLSLDHFLSCESLLIRKIPIPWAWEREGGGERRKRGSGEGKREVERKRKKRRNRKRREDEEKEKMEEERRRKKWKRSGEELNPVSCHLHRSNPTISTLTLWRPQLPQSPHLHIPFAAGFIIQVLEGFLRNSSTKML